MMTPAEARARQYRYGTIYCVYLIAPDGTKHPLGTTARKTGTGLMNLLRTEKAQATVARLVPDAATATFKKSADRLTVSNGWAVTFGGTLIQEAEAAAAAAATPAPVAQPTLI